MSLARSILGAGAALLIAVPAFALEVEKTIGSGVEAAKLWEAVGDFCGIGRWHPAVAKCELEQRDGATVRTLTLNGIDRPLVEKLDARDDAGMSYTYSILDGPLPVQNYTSTLQVRENGVGSLVTWKGTFDAKGVTDAEAEEVITGIYSGGIDSLMVTVSENPR